MANRREVRILVGRRSYRMQTELDDATLNRVVGIVEEVCEAVDDSVDQNHLLMLTCLQLAYNIEKISELLGPLDRKLNNLEPWRPGSEVTYGIQAAKERN